MKNGNRWPKLLYSVVLCCNLVYHVYASVIKNGDVDNNKGEGGDDDDSEEDVFGDEEDKCD